MPGLVWVHGGPGGQSRVGYSGLIQYLVNHGYAIYAINNRGSSGYGKTFYAMDDRKHGEGDLDDCVATKKMLAATGWVDPARIGIIGGSYGGYMVLAALAFRPTRVRGRRRPLRRLQLAAHAGEHPRLVGTAPATPSTRSSGDPKADADYLRKISPLFHADKIERPLIVLQGENDPRVLKAESAEIVDAVKKKGVPVEFLLFPNEGHGFARKETQEKAYTADPAVPRQVSEGRERLVESGYIAASPIGEAASAAWAAGRALNPGKKISGGMWRSSSSRQNPTISSSRSRR